MYAFSICLGAKRVVGCEIRGSLGGGRVLGSPCSRIITLHMHGWRPGLAGRASLSCRYICSVSITLSWPVCQFVSLVRVSTKQSSGDSSPRKVVQASTKAHSLVYNVGGLCCKAAAGKGNTTHGALPAAIGATRNPQTCRWRRNAVGRGHGSGF
jgi:hypothetical protein